MENKTIHDSIVPKVLESGAFAAAVIEAKDVVVDVKFREMCASNLCGNYGKCWTCPPDIGSIESLINELSAYKNVLVYQTVGELEDSYDFESMMDACDKHNLLAQNIRKLFDLYKNLKTLHLGAGGCHICETCAKKTNEPCRHPELALASLEAYGINVSKLAETSGMKYINGQNTVTYFGAVFYNEDCNE